MAKGSPWPPSTSASARCPSGRSTSRWGASLRSSARSARRSYGADNPLIGSPLAYQYLTSLRPDSAARLRGRPRWPCGAAAGGRATRIGSDGLGSGPARDRRRSLGHRASQVRIGRERRLAGRGGDARGRCPTRACATTTPASSSPAALEVRPSLGLILGASASRGDYLSREAGRVPSRRRSRASYRAAGFGVDVEYSRGLLAPARRRRC